MSISDHDFPMRPSMAQGSVVLNARRRGTRRPGVLAGVLVLVLASLSMPPAGAQPGQQADGAAAVTTTDGQVAPETSKVEIAIPGTTVTFTMVRVPAGQAAPPEEGAAAEEFGAFWIAEHEVTWDLYDIFVYALDVPEGDPTAIGADAVSRPSKPYVPPDRGFGHAGYPAMGMTHMAAQEFCNWLSARTGRRFRLPTEAEWEYACRGAAPAPYAFGGDAAGIGDFAWTRENAERSTHPVGEKRASVRGLFDVHGNVAEWTDGRDGKPVAKGGSYRDDAAAARAGERMKQRSSWNASDPQIPKSRWWLADCSWVGFRLVMEDEPEPAAGGS